MWISPNRRTNFCVFAAGLENGALTNAGSGEARVLLRLDDGGEYVHTGRLFIPGI